MADAIRALAIDAVEQAKSGHPGMPMGMADVATVLLTRFLKFDAADPRWPDRDRFVLSAGHGSMLLYALLHLTGHAGMGIEEMQRFRQLHSPAAGHPGIRRASGDRDHHRPARPGHRHRGRHGAGRAHAGRALRQVAGRPPHLGDRLATATCRRASATRPPRLAGHLQLEKLTRPLGRQPHLDRRRHRAVLHRRRAEALLGLWLGGAAGGRARPRAGRRGAVLGDAHPQADADRLPHHHRLRRADQGRHRRRATAARSAATEAAAAKSALGWNHPPFEVPDGLRERWEAAGRRGAGTRRSWLKRLATPPAARRVRARHRRQAAGSLARAAGRAARHASPRSKPKLATRIAVAAALEALVPAVPEMVGGSADLTGSNNTNVKGIPAITPGQFRRPLHPLRRARARHGRGDERHGAAWRRHPLFRHLPGLQPTTCARPSAWPR